MLAKVPALMAAPRPLVVADAVDVELVIQDQLDQLDPTAKTEPMAHLALMADTEMMAKQQPMVERTKAAKNALPLPLAHLAALDPRDHPDPLDPLEMMPVVAEVVQPALLVPLDQQAQMADPDLRDQPALPDKSPNQLEPQAPTAVLALLAALAQMEHPVLQALLAPLAQLAHLATLEPAPHPARMVHLAPRDPLDHLAEVEAATTAHRRAPRPAIKPRRSSTSDDHDVVYTVGLCLTTSERTEMFLIGVATLLRP